MYLLGSREELHIRTLEAAANVVLEVFPNIGAFWTLGKISDPSSGVVTQQQSSALSTLGGRSINHVKVFVDFAKPVLNTFGRSAVEKG
ncbi:hypothetical protein BGZ50_008640 [Haplosporangium sp. Z 11]|nr:hypothetical protein BGZ50_008640 [Haplosporangium sp. Z 11]